MEGGVVVDFGGLTGVARAPLPRPPPSPAPLAGIIYLSWLAKHMATTRDAIIREA
ncbi:hypothetical protein HanIR_Chr08g0376711 [Helianthus annuus]|nr:hypothetical protein HanIR_Chr08g0376711 [Helianthus annuus]